MNLSNSEQEPKTIRLTVAQWRALAAAEQEAYLQQQAEVWVSAGVQWWERLKPSIADAAAEVAQRLKQAEETLASREHWVDQYEEAWSIYKAEAAAALGIKIDDFPEDWTDFDVIERFETIKATRKLLLMGTPSAFDALRSLLESTEKRLTPWERAVCVDYELNGYKYKNRETFVMRHEGLNVSKLKRILPIYEAEVGRTIRTGRGGRKRKKVGPT